MTPNSSGVSTASASGEQDDATVQVDVVRPGQYFSGRRQDQLHDGERQAESHGRAADGEHETLGEELTDDAHLGRAERRPDGQLAPPACGPGQHQVGDVRTADEQHDADRTHQHDEKAPAAAHDLFVERADREGQSIAEAAQAGGVLRRQYPRRCGEVGARLIKRHARLEAGDGAVVVHGCRTRRARPA